MLPDSHDNEFILNYPSRDSQPAVFFEDEPYDDLTDEEEEIWMLLRCIRDPEYPYTLSQLRVVSPQRVCVNTDYKIISIEFTPTVPHCSLSTIIGLSIRIKVLNDFLVDPLWKLIVRVSPGSHKSEAEINKQLQDKERVAAALENQSLMKIINHCIAY